MPTFCTTHWTLAKWLFFVFNVTKKGRVRVGVSPTVFSVQFYCKHFWLFLLFLALTIAVFYFLHLSGFLPISVVGYVGGLVQKIYQHYFFGVARIGSVFLFALICFYIFSWSACMNKCIVPVLGAGSSVWFGWKGSCGLSVRFPPCLVAPSGWHVTLMYWGLAWVRMHNMMVGHKRFWCWCPAVYLSMY